LLLSGTHLSARNEALLELAAAALVIACTCFGSGGMLAYEQLLLLGVV